MVAEFVVILLINHPQRHQKRIQKTLKKGNLDEFLSSKSLEVEQKLFSTIGCNSQKTFLNALFLFPSIKISSKLSILVDNVDSNFIFKFHF